MIVTSPCVVRWEEHGGKIEALECFCNREKLSLGWIKNYRKSDNKIYALGKKKMRRVYRIFQRKCFFCVSVARAGFSKFFFFFLRTFCWQRFRVRCLRRMNKNLYEFTKSLLDNWVNTKQALSEKLVIFKGNLSFQGYKVPICGRALTHFE